MKYFYVKAISLNLFCKGTRMCSATSFNIYPLTVSPVFPWGTVNIPNT
jgi:hypothetical protein